MTPKPPPFHEVGQVTDEIDVVISMQIIGLFSEGLYSSPNKAVEELVSNAFDADATKVHVVMSADRAAGDASIAVIDNGTGMDAQGLKTHWIVGDSLKATNRVTSSGRRTIGKFGIGKLAAYVLGQRLTHVTKANNKYYSTSIDFQKIPKTVDASKAGQAPSSAPVKLDLRELSEEQARSALGAWLTTADGLKDLDLFGEDAEEDWTVAIISDLKPLATDLSAGRLRWVLSTAMPMRDDFVLYLNGTKVTSSKLAVKRIGRWTLGKEVKEIPKPAPDELEVEVREDLPTADLRHWQLTDALLGPVHGYVEAFETPIDTGKSLNVGRSNGFFVYVHGRLINPDDAGFGIDRNKLRHGTFSRFRVVVYIDRLDQELRSSRESLRDGPQLIQARALLQGLFNFARGKIEGHDTATSTERKASQRFADSPLSLTERPIVSLALAAFDGDFIPRHLTEVSHDDFDDADDLQSAIEQQAGARGGIVGEVTYADLGTHQPMAVLDVLSGDLSINLEHPFVAHFADEFGDKSKNLPLQLFAISEILLEAELRGAGLDAIKTDEVLDSRDELLRHLARSSGAQNSFTVANALMESASSVKGLEESVVLAFRQLGYEAIPKAKKGEADGIAEAFLSGDKDGAHRYRVSLEAKSKESVGAKVKKKDVQVSTIARHRDDTNCEHAIVIGPDFETGKDDFGAVIQEIQKDREANVAQGKTITLMRIRDLARLIRIAPVKRVNLDDLRGLYSCSTPDEAEAFVDELESRQVGEAPFKLILEQVWEIQQADAKHAVEYSALRTALRMSDRLTIDDNDLRTECRALSRMAPNQFVAREDRVELNIHPDNVFKVLTDYVTKVNDEEVE